MKKAGLYIRVSTDEQARHGLSLEAQEKTLIEYAKTNGFMIYDIYKDEGTSARKNPSRRTEFCRMIKDVKAGKLTHILFIKLDRWFRNIADYYKYQAILDEYKVEWIATEEQYNTTTSQGRLYLNIKLSIAQNESDITSERIKFVFEKKKERKEAISGQVPFGYKIENKKIVKNEHAPVVVDMFNYFLTCQNLRRTAKYITQKYNINQSAINVRRILKKEKYTGRAYGQDNYLEPIIDKETFARVQRILAKNRGPCENIENREIYLFKGLLRCPKCERVTSGMRHLLANKEYSRRYRCYRYLKEAGCNYSASVSELEVEALLLKKLKQEIKSTTLKYAKLQTESESSTASIKYLKERLLRLNELYVDGYITRDKFDSEQSRIRTELYQLESKEFIKPKILELNDVDFITLYNKLDREHKSQFWRTFVYAIRPTVDEKNHVVNISVEFL